MKIGGSFKDCDKVQKSVRRDPHPGVPFCDAELPYDKVEERCAIAIVVIIVLVIIAMWAA